MLLTDGKRDYLDTPEGHARISRGIGIARGMGNECVGDSTGANAGRFVRGVLPVLDGSWWERLGGVP